SASVVLDPPSDLVDVLRRAKVKGKTISFGSGPALRTVVEVQDDADTPRRHRNAAKGSLPLNAAVEGEAHDVDVPRDALLEVFHGQRCFKGFTDQRSRFRGHQSPLADRLWCSLRPTWPRMQPNAAR